MVIDKLFYNAFQNGASIECSLKVLRVQACVTGNYYPVLKSLFNLQLNVV